MNGIVIASLLMLTGFCAYAAMNHAFIAFSRPFSRVHFLFSASCICLVAFELLHFLTYTAPTLTEYIPRLKWEITVILLLFILFPWFISEYTGIRPRWLLLGVTAFTLALVVTNVFQPFSLQFVEISRLEHLQLPWGETVQQPVGRNGVGYFAAVAAVLVAFFFGLYALGVSYYRNRTGMTLAMLLAIGVVLITGGEGILVRMSVIDFIHLGPFGIPTMLIVMSMVLNQETRHKLRASENRYRSLVEQSPFSMQVLSPDGRTLQVNRAWENLWGVDAERIVGYNVLQDQQLRDNGIMPYLEKGFGGSATELPPIQYNPAENPSFTGPSRDRWVRAYVFPIKDEAGVVREVVLLHEDVTQKQRFEDAIRLIASGISAEIGDGFFHQLTKSLAELFGTRYAFIGVLESLHTHQVTTVSVYAQGVRAPNMTYDLEGTPCAMVVGQHTCVYPRDVQRLFPQDHLLVEMGADSYIGTPLFDPKGDPLGIIVLLDDQPLHDIDQMTAIMEIVAARVAAEIERNKAGELLRQQHKRLQEMVDDRTAELQAAVKELEAFSYSVSHDLRAPLRSIDGFSQVLAEDYATLLDDQGKDFLGRIRNNAQHMATLIDDLLQLSRVTRKDFNKRPVNLSELVISSINKHREQDPLRKVEIDIAANVIVDGDPDLLAIAIENLVSNAWKYTSKTEHAVIAFGTQNQDGKLIYFIKDNGAGFDMQYAGKIFSAFQRLHTALEFEGTGIGLATVVRIINRHGGEIWAEAQPNAGATFYFRFPDGK
jgi:signal transduction histidine kinase/PAS domain-containing protein